MSVYDLVGKTEKHPTYQILEAQNRDRQYGFLESIVRASLDLNAPYLTHGIVRALNYHAIAHLHVAPGQFRHKEVRVGEYNPPPAHEIEYRMGRLMHYLRISWNNAPAGALGAYVLWSINHIHPFENGNGRTARAACHYVICTKVGHWLGGRPILPELIRLDRNNYIQALKQADNGNGLALISLVQKLLRQSVGIGRPS